MSANRKGVREAAACPQDLIMKSQRKQSHVLPLVTFVLVSVLSAALPRTVEAGDVGVGRRIGGIAEIDLVSAVNGSTVARSLPTQEGAPEIIRIIDVDANVVLASGAASADGQYAIVLPQPLATGQHIQAFNDTENFYSSSVLVTAAYAPAIDEPIARGALLIKGRGTPGNSIQIRNVVTGALLGAGTVVAARGITNGAFSIKLNRSLPLFHTIQVHDVTQGLSGKIAPILNLPIDHSPLNLSCGMNQVVSGDFIRKTFTCGLPRPRGVMVDTAGDPLIVAGAAPLDPGYALLPAALFVSVEEQAIHQENCAT